MDISGELKRIRMLSLLSQQDFANAIGVSYCTVNRWENNRAIPNYKTLKKVKLFCEKNEIEFNIIMVGEEG